MCVGAFSSIGMDLQSEVADSIYIFLVCEIIDITFMYHVMPFH